MDCGWMKRRSIGWILLALLAPLQAQDPVLPLPSATVFTVVFEVKANSSDGTSATSQVEVQFAPGLEWKGYFGTNFGGVDLRTPQKLYKVRGGLYGLRPGEPMCFGILKHKGTASAGGRTLTGPGSIQTEGWTLHEDAARFTRTEDGGELRVGPVTYQDEDPPEFGLISPGAYDGGPAGTASYTRMLTFHFTNEELRNFGRVKKVNQASINDPIAGVRQFYKSSLNGGEPEDETEVSVEPEDYDRRIPEGELEKSGKAGKAPEKKN